MLIYVCGVTINLCLLTVSAIVREILAPDFSTIVPSSAPETFGPLLSDISQVNLATMQTSGETLNDLLIASFAQVPDCLADYSQASADETYYNFWGEATKNGHVQDMSGPSGSCLHTYDTEMLRITPNFGTAVGGQLVKAEADIVGDINSNLEGLLVHPIEYLENVLPEGNADVFSSPGSASPVYSRGSVSIPRLSPVLFPLTPGRVEEESPEGNALSTSLESTLPHGQFRTMLPIKPEGRKEPAVPDRPQPPMTPVKPPPAAHSGGFTFIQEYNGMKELSTVGPTRTPKRGRRVGPLDQAQRLGARRVRNERIVCIRCRKDKQTVSLETACQIHNLWLTHNSVTASRAPGASTSKRGPSSHAPKPISSILSSPVP